MQQELTKITLPELSYGYNALSPVLVGEILEIHHKKHHQGYVNKYNAAVEALVSAAAKGDAEGVQKLCGKVAFTAGGHNAHKWYWENLAPADNGGGILPEAKAGLSQAVVRDFGSSRFGSSYPRISVRTASSIIPSFGNKRCVAMFTSLAFRACLLASTRVLASYQDSDEFAEACSSGACPLEHDEAVKGSAMLQFKKVYSEACSTEHAQQQPLTEAGFQQISKSCCYEDVKVFARRLIDDMGLKVCDEGGLSGIAPFYSCPLAPVSFAELKDDIKKAMPSEGSKCHWLQERYAECTEPALECAVSAQKPSPAPKPVASGFFAFKVTNPSEMMRSSKAIDAVKEELALSLGLTAETVNVVIGSGPLDGEEVVSSLFIVPESQAFISLGGTAKQCKVFAVYSIQEPAPTKKSITTPAPSLDEDAIVTKLKHFDTVAFGKKLTQDLAEVDRPAGTVEVIEETVCEKTSLKCTHEVCRGK